MCTLWCGRGPGQQHAQLLAAGPGAYPVPFCVLAWNTAVRMKQQVGWGQMPRHSMLRRTLPWQPPRRMVVDSVGACIWRNTPVCMYSVRSRECSTVTLSANGRRDTVPETRCNPASQIHIQSHCRPSSTAVPSFVQLGAGMWWQIRMPTYTGMSALLLERNDESSCHAKTDQG